MVEILNAVEANIFMEIDLDNRNIESVSMENSLISSFILHQNFPNPFNPSTTIQYSTDSHSNIKIVIFNVYGQKIKTLVDRYESSGNHTVTWNATDDNGNEVSSGIYIYQLSANGINTQKQMLLLR